MSREWFVLIKANNQKLFSLRGELESKIVQLAEDAMIDESGAGKIKRDFISQFQLSHDA